MYDADWNSGEDGKPSGDPAAVAAAKAKLEAQRIARNKRARERRAAVNDAMDSVGMKRARGNLGGTYWE